MKLKSGVIINEINGEYVAVAAGEAGKAFNGMIKMNGTAAFIAKTLQNETDEDGIVSTSTSYSAQIAATIPSSSVSF